MLGLLLAVGFAWFVGTALSYLFGVGHLGTSWHLAFGLAGMALGWFFLLVLRVPYWLRVSVNGIDVFPVWASVGTAMVVVVAALVVPARRGGGGAGS